MVCVVCRKVFSRMSSLTRHINDRQTSCHPPTHHCEKCDNGFSSYQTLWEHRRKCLSSPVEKQPTKVISDSTVSPDPFADQSSSLKVIPYMLPSKEDGIDSPVLTPPTRNPGGNTFTTAEEGLYSIQSKQFLLHLYILTKKTKIKMVEIKNDCFRH